MLDSAPIDAHRIVLGSDVIYLSDEKLLTLIKLEKEK